ncbi:ABC transporter ATP-binding protein [Peribacillus simplex]|uniref:ABC transporter ATP-binding protein n=1 Tax=Peribacillus simplex TaxID=1478 RepID=UPI00298D9A96|nr:ABC transporter ATP-binding protein [Peribacillus simplex]MDW7614466.1 ABC transporter ATP-binding protein [Peribacillus simplex]
MKQVTLSVKGLKKRIGKREIIKGIDFELNEGEVFGFLGPNGAGKTTTIRMLVGLIKPSSGSIHICGHDVRQEFTKAMKQMGCIVENPDLYLFLSGWNNLLHFARMLPEVDEKRMIEVVELVGLQARIHDKVKTYSLGMRQRLGIAQAMLNSPKLLILDEPTNGLDPAGIREMRQFIRKLAEEEGMSVLVSSHLLGEIQQLCDRVAIIKSGEIIKTDTVERLLSTQERMIWRVEPLQKGVEILSGFTDITLDQKYIITAYDEFETPEWNAALNQAGVKVHEMNRKLPGLEELFLQVTGVGGGSIE